jgi:50S ribosomal subunit-associated GTPase HflX
MVFNKIDRIDEQSIARLRALYPEAVCIAAARGQGLDALQERLAQFFDRALRPVRLLFPYSAAAEMHRLRGLASDVREEHTPDGIILEARLPVAEAGRYARYSVDAAPADPDGPSESEAGAVAGDPGEGGEAAGDGV